MIAFVLIAALGGIALTYLVGRVTPLHYGGYDTGFDLALGVASWAVVVVYWIGVVNFVLTVS